MTLYVLIVSLYIAYLAFAAGGGQAGVDYHTFMEQGQRLLNGEQVYTTNSYYPLPYVTIFAVFSAMPATISLVLWHTLPLLVVIWAARWQLWPLLFAPVFAHFAGGQSSVVGLIVIAGILRYPNNWRGGVCLAIALLKPQLAVLPLLWYMPHWVYYIVQRHRLPAPALSLDSIGNKVWWI